MCLLCIAVHTEIVMFTRFKFKSYNHSRINVVTTEWGCDRKPVNLVSVFR